MGLVFAYLTGLVDRVNKADVTKLSFVITGMFLYYSSKIGFFLFKRKEPRGLRHDCEFVSNAFLNLGMIGTVIGFIYMLNISFGGLGSADMTSLRMALQTMGIGMGTALYTTAVGLVCSFLLRLQLYVFMEKE